MKKTISLTLSTTLAMALASTVSAHSRMNTTMPENGAILAQVPAVINLEFAKSIRLTRVEMIHLDHPPVRLDLSEQTGFERGFTLPLEGMGDGIYRIEWRGLGMDGHAMQGDFSFTVD